VTAVLAMVAAAAIGGLLGFALTATYAAAAISRSQERMERKIRYWQAETARAREIAERVARQLAARELWTKPDPRQEW
jgi:type II secretory pathway component PulJ